ncbi:MAG: fumarylacetoacetate hydrolase family protein [bacterium]|nr:fumarylacetoacetate hydrolase family protein [bacterium]
MKLIAFSLDGHQRRIGILHDNLVYDLRDLFVALAKQRDWPVLPVFDFADFFDAPTYANFDTLQAAYELSQSQGVTTYELDRVKLLAPFAKGAKMIAIGRNYGAHARELGNELPTEPMYFAKLASCVIAPGEPIVLPPESNRVDHEGELAVVLGKRLSKPKLLDEALAAVFGYTCANDVTARDIQKAAAAKGQPWTRGKNYDTFCPIGPCIVTADSYDASAVDVRCRVNGEIKQDGNTRDFIFSVGTLLHYVSQHITLEPGDVLLTGTPEGVSPLSNGDIVEVSINGIGSLTNPVKAL